MYFRPTIILLVAAVVVGALWDIWAVSHSYSWTLSANLYWAAKEYPIIPFTGGVLVGHLLWNNDAAKERAKC